MPEVKLLPCPACGEKRIDFLFCIEDNGNYFAACASCWANGPMCPEEEDAIADWNGLYRREKDDKTCQDC